jgi:uncharacterized repeat protein (TIGR02543 family)
LNSGASDASYTAYDTSSTPLNYTVTVASNNSITYDNQGATSNQIGGSVTYISGSSIATIPSTAPQKTGYTFKGWFTASSGGTQVTNASYTPATPYGPVTLYAQWSTSTFKISVTQGSNGTISPSTPTVNYGSDQAFTINAAAGHSIATVIVDGVSNPTAASAGSYTFSNVIAIHSITATFSANTYTITYNHGANGAGGPLTQSFAFGSNPNLKNANAAIIRAGYSISGWTTTDGTSQSHALGASYTNASDLTLYPVWSANTLVITFNSQTGSAIAPASTTTGGSVADPGNPTLSRYTFSGWFTSASGGTKITFPYIHGQTADFILYAQWSPNNQSALTLTSVNGVAGTSLLLTTSGGSGVGQITFSVTGSGCTLTTDPVVALNTSAAGICTVTVTKAADATYLLTTSAATTVTFLAYTITSGSGSSCPNNATSGTTISVNSCQSVTSPVIVAPKIMSMSASSGKVGESITITGINLNGVTVVKFGGVIASVITNTATTVVLNVPSGAINGRITLSTLGGTSIGPSFTVTN